MNEVVLEVQDLCTYFFGRTSITKAVNGISYDVSEGEIVAVVGESGCGKSVGVLSLIKLNPPGSQIIKGQVLWKGRDLMKMSKYEMSSSHIRGKEISMVFQEPLTALNPIQMVGRQIAEMFEVHGKLDDKEKQRKVIEMLEMVAIPDPEKIANVYPFQLSGGMRQRVMLAMALSCHPSLIIADEPTTALDVTIQAQLLETLASHAREMKTAVILITHNLGIAARYAQKIFIMYAGKIVEKAGVEELYSNPRHPYTMALLQAVPRLDGKIKTKLVTIGGQPPALDERIPPGCPFHPRCRYAQNRCKKELPPLQKLPDNHEVACWLVEGG